MIALKLIMVFSTVVLNETLVLKGASTLTSNYITLCLLGFYKDFFLPY